MVFCIFLKSRQLQTLNSFWLFPCWLHYTALLSKSYNHRHVVRFSAVWLYRLQYNVNNTAGKHNLLSLVASGSVYVLYNKICIQQYNIRQWKAKFQLILTISQIIVKEEHLPFPANPDLLHGNLTCNKMHHGDRVDLWCSYCYSQLPTALHPQLVDVINNDFTFNYSFTC